MQILPSAAVATTTIGLNTSILYQYLHSTPLFVFLECWDEITSFTICRGASLGSSPTNMFMCFCNKWPQCCIAVIVLRCRKNVGNVSTRGPLHADSQGYGATVAPTNYSVFMDSYIGSSVTIVIQNTYVATVRRSKLVASESHCNMHMHIVVTSVCRARRLFLLLPSWCPH